MGQVKVLLDPEDSAALKEQLKEELLSAIKEVRQEVGLDRDLLLTKQDLMDWLGCSATYLEGLLADGLPRGRKLSDRKQVFSKSEIRIWLLNKNK